MEKEKLIELLKHRLDAVGHSIDFEVVEDGVRRDGDWWYVPVVATRNGQEVTREFAVNVYANVEDEFQQQHGVSILFVPAINEPAGQ